MCVSMRSLKTYDIFAHLCESKVSLVSIICKLNYFRFICTELISIKVHSFQRFWCLNEDIFL